MAYASVADVLASLEEELRYIKFRLSELERKLAEVEEIARRALEEAEEASEAVGELELKV